MPIEDDNTASEQADVEFLSEGETGLVPVTDTAEEPEVYESEDVELTPVDDNLPASQSDDIPAAPSGEMLTPQDRVAFAQVKKVYPDFFKKFPGLGRVIQREREYAAIFPTIDMAKEASDNSNALQVLEDDVANGDLTKFLRAVKDMGDPALMNLSKRFLASLAQVSMDAHWQAALPLLQNTVRAFYNQGAQLGQTEQGQNYSNSALYLSQYLFNDFEVATGKKTMVAPIDSIRPKPEDSYDTQRYNDYWQDVANLTAEKLSAMILEKDAEGTYRIDPNGVMSEWLRNTVAQKIFAEVQEQMSADKSHQAYMNSLWTTARKNKTYNRETTAKIQNAFLARARPLIASIRPRLSAEATGTRVRTERQSSMTTTRRDPRSQGAQPTSRTRTPLAREVDWGATSDLDILNGTETLKRR